MRLNEIVSDYENFPHVTYAELKENIKELLAQYKADYGDFPLMYVPSDSYGVGGYILFVGNFSEDLEKLVNRHYPDLDKETFDYTIENMTFCAIPLEDLEG